MALNYNSILLNNINCEYELKNQNIFYFHPANNLENIFQLYFSENISEKIRGTRLFNKLNKNEQIDVIPNDGNISDLEYLNILLDHKEYEKVELLFHKYLKENEISFSISENGVEIKNTTEEIKFKLLFIKLDYFYRKENRTIANLLLKSLLGVTNLSMKRLLNYYNLQLNNFYVPFDHKNVTVDIELPLKLGFEYFFAVANFLKNNFRKEEAAKIFYENGFYMDHIKTSNSISAVDMYIELCRKYNTENILTNQLSRLYFERGQITKSIDDYEKSISIVKNSQAYFAIGKIYWSEKRNELAEEFFKKSLSFGRQSDYLFTYSTFLLSIDRNIQAENIFKELELLNKHSFRISYNLALALLRNGKYIEAYNKFKRVHQISPSKSVNGILKKIKEDFLN